MEHQRDQRLAAQRRRTNSGRQWETTPERELRQAGEAARSRSRRERETTPERELRRAGEAARSRSRRERETTPERELHRAGEAARSRSRREREMTPERELCRAGEAARSQSRRQRETTPERELHQAVDATRSTLIRREREHEYLSSYDKLLKFSEAIASTKSSKCDTCLENFPTLSVSTQLNGVNECSRCANDKCIPKLYSMGNNMDPGAVPTQLQVLMIILL